MRHKERQQMCLGCDGRIPIDAQECPYCGTTLENTIQKEEAAVLKHNQNHVTSLYPPPYSARNLHSSSEEHNKEAQPKHPASFKGAPPEKRWTGSGPVNNAPISIEGEAEQTSTDTSSFWPLLLLTVGANLLMLGLLQLFFSDQGFLRLEWDSSYWFVYCLCAAPLIFLGFKKIKQLK